MKRDFTSTTLRDYAVTIVNTTKHKKMEETVPSSRRNRPEHIKSFTISMPISLILIMIDWPIDFTKSRCGDVSSTTSSRMWKIFNLKMKFRYCPIMYHLI
jgi:hypothetical protein